MIIMKVLVTGGTGFIGSNLVDYLMKCGYEVVVLDNLSSGNIKNTGHLTKNKNFSLIRGDLLKNEDIEKSLMGVSKVYHLAANPEVRAGENSPKIHFDQNILASFNLLEAMRKNDINDIVFTSSSTVYGDAKTIPTSEEYPTMPISTYGASKLAVEGLISSYFHTYGIKSMVFRFANVIGKRSNHGVIVDFIKKLRNNPNELEILGDGTQSKSYMLVEECVDAMQHCVAHAKDSINILNLGSEDQITASRIGEILIEELRLKNTVIRYTGGKRGWLGDIPEMMLSTKKLNDLAWRTKYSSDEAIRKASRTLIDEIWKR